MTRKTKRTLLTYLAMTVGALYLPIYIAFFLLLKVARLLLAISYFGLLCPRKGIDILKSIFRDYDYL